MFRQMDEMFRHLDNMMRGMHLGPDEGGSIQGAVITELEEESADGARNPRDAMLKNPDSSSQRTPQPPQPHHPPSPVNPQDQYEGDEFANFGGFGAFGGFGKVMGPFRMMEDFFGVLEGRPAIPYQPGPDPEPPQPHHPPSPVNPQHQYEGDEFANFGGFGGFGKVMDPFRMMEDLFGVLEGRPAIPQLPVPDPVPIHPRDSVVKKDTDLDDSGPCGMGHLLDEGPKYEGTNQGSGKQGDCDGQPCPGNPQSFSSQQPGGAIQPTHPEMQTRFHSTSVIRVRKPDGSIEETRKYRDHTGREEVTVQCKEPDEVDPGVIQRGNDNHGVFYPPGDHMPSTFSRGFRWW